MTGGPEEIPLGPGIPAECRRCGGLVRTPDLPVWLGEVWSPPGTTLPCPCGGTADVFSGWVDITAQGLRPLHATPDNIELLRRAGALVEDLLQQGASPEEIVTAVGDQVSPDVARHMTATREYLARFAKWTVKTVVGTAIVAVSTVGVTEGAQRVWPEKTSTQVDPPEGSEGTVRYPDGTVMRWGPGTRPTTPRYQRPGPQP